MRVRASTPGQYQLSIPNLSYEDHVGRVRHLVGVIAEITVEPEPVAAPVPRLSVESLTTALPLGRWDTLHGRVTNIGESDVRDLEVILSGQVVTDERDNRCSVERLTAGASVDLEFQVRALESGDRVPVYFDLSYRGPDGSHQTEAKHTVRVDSAETITTPDRSSAPPDPAGPAI
jgi:hypothetical protein